MAATPHPARSRALFFFAVGAATLLAAWLRAYGVTGQVVLDDEWHAIHKLSSSTYAGIFSTFGLYDHSIPLTLLYKSMADTIGLAEGRLRILQIACGVALVPVCAWVAQGAMRDRAAAALFAFLVAGAPFLVMWSRFARPYAISLLFVVLAVAALWRWRTERSVAMAACAALTAALATWFHPLAGIYPALACIYVFAEDLRTKAHPWRQSLGMGAGVAAAMSVLLVAPILHDRASLTGKAGGDHPNLDTYERMFSLVWGGLPVPAYVLALGLAAWGFVVVARRQPALGGLLALLAVVPAVFLTAMGAVWIQSGQNFLRYQLPLLPLALFLGSIGAIGLVRAVGGRAGEPAAWIATFALSAAYLAATPAIGQVAKLGTWYAHLGHHWDYRHRWMDYMRGDSRFDPPEFYRKLGVSASGTIIEAPYIWEAPFNPLAYYARYHHQRALFGMVHDLCREGSERRGEVPPRDRRFRFRRFVFLDDPRAVKASGARYLVVNRGIGTPATAIGEPCISKLAQLYGTPLESDARVVVWELNP